MSSRILVVDDDDDIREYVIACLETLDGCMIAEAENGKVALEIAKKDNPGIILLDMAMPILDGFSTLEQLGADKGLSDIPVLALTSLSGTDDIVKVLSLGARDYIKKPFVLEELLARVRMQLALKHSLDDLQQRDKRLAHELMLAKETQERLFPAQDDIKHVEDAHGYKIFVFSQASSEINGDLVDIKTFPKKGFSLTVADCMGHGVSAALMTMAISSFLSTDEDPAAGPGKAFYWLNRSLLGLIDAHQPIVAIQFHHNDSNGQTLCRAGFSYPILYRKKDSSVTHLSAGNTFLGFIDTSFDQIQLDLDIGDKLVLYSDGISDARNSWDQFFSMTTDRIGEMLAYNADKDAHALGDTIIHAWNDFRTGKQTDDATLVVIEKC